MEVICECTYCGKKWEQNVYSYQKEIRCSVCGDRNVKVTEKSKSKFDAYAGSAPFPSKKSSDDFPWGGD